MKTKMASGKIIDLEEAVQTWAWNAFEKTRTKVKLEFENAFLDINWSRVNFSPRQPQYFEQEVKEPSSKTIFKSVFKNESDTTQNHTFRVERQTTATCTSSLTNGYSKGFNIGLTLAAPGDVAEAAVGFEKGFTVENASESTDEKTLTWATDGNLEVPKKSTLTAELQIQETKRSYTFTTSVAISGKVTVAIHDRTNNNNLVMSVMGDIKEVLLKDKKIKEIKEEGNAAVIVIKGKCDFSFGIEQEIKCK